MLSMFCGKNKGNKKGRVPSEELDLNLYCAQKVLADTNKKTKTFGGINCFVYLCITNETDSATNL